MTSPSLSKPTYVGVDVAFKKAKSLLHIVSRHQYLIHAHGEESLHFGGCEAVVRVPHQRWRFSDDAPFQRRISAKEGRGVLGAEQT